jgi:YidC/Oxa1 family membrane protein insertase
MNFDFLFTSFGSVLAQLYELRHSYGLMIIGLTLIVMVVVTPLTLKATRSMLMMQQLQPELKKLQSKYKDDRQKLNEELLAFYRENNINPVGGCLPLLVQTPVFLVLYNVLRGLTLRVPTTGTDLGHSVGQHLAGSTPLTNAPSVVRTFDPQYLPTDSTLYENLRASTEMRSLGLDLARSASDLISTDVVGSIPYLVLIALVAVTGVVQQRQIQSRSSGAAINPQQQMIMKFMPLFLPVFSFALPAGLVLYFVVSNTYRVGQQWFISRNIYGKHQAATGDDEGGAKERGPEEGGPAAGGGLMGWLDRLLGRTAEPSAPDRAKKDKQTKRPSGGERAARRAPVSTAKTKTGGGSAKAGSGASGRGGKGGRSTGRGTAVKAEPGSRGSRSERNGRSRDDAASGKEKAEKRPERPRADKAETRAKNAPGPVGRAATKKTTSASERRTSTSRPPTLQPRARKNKKR